MVNRLGLIFAIMVAPGSVIGQESNDCLILPGETVEIGGAIPGQLSKVSVEVGDFVTAGTEIAALRSEVQESLVKLAEFRASNTAAIEAARARLNYEKRELARAEQLRERGVATSATIEERQTAFEIRLRELEDAEMMRVQAELELERARAELEIRSIRAPIDGIVAKRNLDPGEYLRDDGAVAVLVSTDPLIVEAFFQQEDYNLIRSDLTATVVADSGGDVPHQAVVKTVDAVIDAASATFSVRLTLPNPDHQIVAGVRCRISFNQDG